MIKNTLKNKGKSLKLTTLGFTLIELLAVIILLAIISLIAFPIVLNIINNTKENAFKESITGIVDDAILESALKINEEELLYKYENNNWGEFKLNIDGEIPKYIEVKVNKDGKVRYAITDGVYCALKEYNNKLNIKKISNENTNKKIEEQYCKLDKPIPTKEICFTFNNGSITDYDASCGTDVVIPEKINNVDVIGISSSSFKNKGLTSIDFSYANKLKSIGYYAFQRNKISNINWGECESLSSISPLAFNNNNLHDDQAIIYGRKEHNGKYVFDETIIVSYGGYNKNVVIPSNVEIIGNEAYSQSGIESIDFSGAINLKTIKGSAFTANNISTIEFRNCENLEVIGNHAFYSAGRIKNLDLSVCKNLKQIGSMAFYMFVSGDLKLNNLINLESIGSDAFSPLISSVDLTNCSKLSSIGNEAFYGVTYIKNGTGKAFNWKLIVDGSNGETFETGTVIKSNGSSVIVEN